MNPSDGSIFTVKAFTHAPNLTYARPAISTHYIADTGNPASSIDLWRITGHHLVTLATNLRTTFPSVRGFAFERPQDSFSTVGRTTYKSGTFSRPAACSPR